MSDLKKPFSDWNNPLSKKLRGDPNIDQRKARDLMNKSIIIDDIEWEKHKKKPLFTNLTPIYRVTKTSTGCSIYTYSSRRALVLKILSEIVVFEED